MQINRLRIHGFRCLEEVDFKPQPINILTGPNGIGKTTVLEAIYLLSSGRSFRSSGIRHLVRSGCQQLALHAEINEQGYLYQMGLSKEVSGKLTVRLQGETQKGITPLSSLLPVVVIHSQSYSFIDTNPDSKRRFLDWLVFHVKPHHLADWKNYRQLLLHTNALLKKGDLTQSNRHFWYEQLAAAGEKLNCNRHNVFGKYVEGVKTILQKPRFSKLGIELEFNRGWSKESNFFSALMESDERNRKYGAVQVGPHRMDMEVKSHGKPADKTLSRGQKKVVAIQLHLQQVNYIQAVTNRWPVLCLDDLDSELDEANLHSVMQDVLATDAQVFISSLHAETLKTLFPPDECPAVFHVKHWEKGREK